MSLPTDFQFSQGSLQDFVDCQRRFQLRYLLRLAWPAVEAEPALEQERLLQQGALFHRLVHQHLLGVPDERLSAMAAGDEDLAGWWRNFLDHGPAIGPGVAYPEITLSAPLREYRLVAKYDLIIARPNGRAVIYDWKTSQRRTPRQWLVRRLQTRVYPYLLVQAGAHVSSSGQPFQPQDVEMVYWFAGFPQRPERFTYDVEQYKEDSAYLAALVERIETLSLGEEEFPLTPLVERCRYCVYRSLCDRGKQAGSLDEVVEPAEFDSAAETDFELDFEQIAEITY